MSNIYMDQLPHYYTNIRDFVELSVPVSESWQGTTDLLAQIENDQFIMTSSEYAIALREKDFGIVADPRTEPLNFRKLRLLARMQENVPYTLEYFKHLLETLVGSGNYEVALDIIKLEMEISVYAEQAIYHREVELLAERIVPLNIDLMTTTVLLTEVLLIKYGSYGFNINYKRTNKFSTAVTPGTGLLLQQLTVYNQGYGFETKYPVTNKFHTAATAGESGTELDHRAHFSVYSFEQGLKKTGKFVAKGEF